MGDRGCGPGVWEPEAASVRSPRGRRCGDAEEPPTTNPGRGVKILPRCSGPGAEERGLVRGLVEQGGGGGAEAPTVSSRKAEAGLGR